VHGLPAGALADGDGLARLAATDITGATGLGRTPFLWFANLCAEYNLRLGKNVLSLNANLDNAFNVATAIFVYQWRMLDEIAVPESQILSKSRDLNISGYIPDPRFKKASAFYPPITARLGVLFSF